LALNRARSAELNLKYSFRTSFENLDKYPILPNILGKDSQWRNITVFVRFKMATKSFH
jgi:hypothetical protein